MRDKKVVILIILAIIAVISLLYGIGARSKGGAKIAYTAPAGNLQQPPSQTALSTQRRARRSKFTSLERNPFVPAGSPRASSKLTLNGIVGSGANLKAIIGDAVVGKGDRISGNTVIEVRKNGVTLNDGTNDIELKLKE